MTQHYRDRDLGPKSVIKFCSGIHLTVSSSIIIFGIGVPPIWQGVFGVITALEGYYGAVQSDLSRVFNFLLGLLVNGIVAVILGFLAISDRTHSECASEIKGQAVRKEYNFTITFNGIISNCSFSYEMYAYVQFGTAVLSGILFAPSFAWWLAARKRKRANYVRRDEPLFLLGQ